MSRKASPARDSSRKGEKVSTDQAPRSGGLGGLFRIRTGCRSADMTYVGGRLCPPLAGFAAILGRCAAATGCAEPAARPSRRLARGPARVEQMG